MRYPPNEKQKRDKPDRAEHHRNFPRYHSSSGRIRADGGVFRIADEVFEHADGENDDYNW